MPSEASGREDGHTVDPLPSQGQGRVVLVTGAAGYIGSVTVRALLAHDYSVVAVDRLDFGGQAIVDLLANPRFSFHRTDINDHAALDGIVARHRPWAILHLAAIVGDPACAAQPDEAERTNLQASLALLESARRNAVNRFVFASTCSNYGRMADDAVTALDENAPLAPISLYARTKVAFEAALLEPRSDTLCPTALRFATVYGLSGRMRFDLTVNEFTRDMVTGRGLEIYGAQFWRPYCHVGDFAQAYLRTLGAPETLVRNAVFNVGDSAENYTKGMIVEALQDRFPDSPVTFVHKDEDPRNYKVDFTRIREQLGFRASRTVADGMDEITAAIRAGLIEDPYASVYHNLTTSR